MIMYYTRSIYVEVKILDYVASRIILDGQKEYYCNICNKTLTRCAISTSNESNLN